MKKTKKADTTTDKKLVLNREMLRGNVVGGQVPCTTNSNSHTTWNEGIND